MEDKKEKIVIVRETTVSSVIQDIVTFGLIVLSYWINHQFIADNVFLSVLLFISFFTMSLSHLKNFNRLQEQMK